MREFDIETIAHNQIGLSQEEQIKFLRLCDVLIENFSGLGIDMTARCGKEKSTNENNENDNRVFHFYYWKSYE